MALNIENIVAELKEAILESDKTIEQERLL